MRALRVSLLVASLAPSAALAQQALPFPLAPAGLEEWSGQEKLAPRDGSAIAALVGRDAVVLTDLALPGVGEVDLELERIPLEDLELGFQVNGQPAPGLLVGLELSVWKGKVVGEPASDVLLSFSTVGTRGWVDAGARRFHLLPQPGDGLNWRDGYSVVVESAELAKLGMDLGMTCGSEKLERNALADDEVPSGEPGAQYLGGGGTANLWECSIAIETDFQMNQLFGGDLAAETAYVTTLIAAGSDRYVEQNDTRFVFPYVQFYTSAADPWSSQDTGGNSGDLLNEFVAAWGGAALPGGADLGHFLSGASLGGGVAYLSALCDTQNNFSFGVSGSLHGSTPFPIQVGPLNWDFVVFTHELGHNFSSPHTHDFCPPLDECAPPAYFGSCQTQQVCISNGTIMGYCHLCPGGLSNVTTYFHPSVVSTIASHVQACLPIVFGISATPPVVVPPTVPTTPTATVSGSPASIEMSYRLSSGASFTTVPMTAQGGGVYAATLPAPTCLDAPEFYFSVSDGSAAVSTETFTPSVGTTTTLFVDDFQNDLGWTVGAVDDTATTGIWTRVDPNPTSAQPGEGVNPGSGPFCFVTGQGSVGGALGENDVDGGKTTLFSPVFDLSGTNATIGYYRWYSNTAGASPNADIFEVEITNDGATWVDVETVGPTGPDTSGGWNYHEFDVASLVTPSATVQVRFVASDLDAGSIVEAAVDQFEVFELDCPVGPLPPIADFTGAPLSGAHPLSVSFTDTSGGIVTAWSWSFGDGGSSSAQDPVHTYTAAGTFTVSLTATGPDGMDTETKPAFVVVSEPAPVADFSGAPTVGVHPLTVSFTDASSGPVTSWSWTFGDGETSSVQSPVHTYDIVGTYSVALSVAGPGGSDSLTRNDYVVVNELPPAADFSGTPTSGLVPLTVSFTDLSTGLVSGWLWSFGDLGTSTDQNPTHTYAFPGTFTVSLSAMGPGGADVETKTGYVVVTNPVAPTASFTAMPTSGAAPLSVSFTDTSTGDVTGWSWSFGDGASSTVQSPTHVYASVGTYTVALTAEGPGGSHTVTMTDLVTVQPPAMSVFRNGSGLNPACFVAGGPVLGASWMGSVDSSVVGGTTLTAVLARTGSIPGVILATGELLIDPGSTVLFNSVVASGGGLDAHAFSVPNNVAFLGNVGHMQAFLWPSLQWCNAAQLTVGVTNPTPAPTAMFNAAPATGPAPHTVFFTDASTGSFASWVWDFGDGSSSTLQNPSHTYSAPGTYSVSLTVQGEGGYDATIQQALITVQ